MGPIIYGNIIIGDAINKSYGNFDATPEENFVTGTLSVVDNAALGYSMFSILPARSPTPSSNASAAAKGVPKPTPNFKTPTNAPRLPPSTVPEGMTVRVMKPTQQYPNGYWRLEKPMPQGGAQGINPTTMKPGPQHETHVPLPPGYWK